MPFADIDDKRAWRRAYRKKNRAKVAAWEKDYQSRLAPAKEARRRIKQEAAELKENLRILTAVMRSEAIKAEATHREKLCNKCGKIKPFSEMITSKQSPNGVARECMQCRQIYNKEYHTKHPEVRKRGWARQSKKRKQDPVKLMRMRISDRMSKAIKAHGTGSAVSGSKMKYLGCTAQMAADHIERLMRPPMTWGNYGAYWQVDHIRPLDSYDLSKEDERYHAFHYTNLQPLSSTENRLKWNKWDKTAQQTVLMV